MGGRLPDRVSRPRSRRRGVNLLGLLLFLMILLAVGMAVSHLARQSGRTSHWFYLSQVAHNLADAALKESLVRLEEAARAVGPPVVEGDAAAPFRGLAGALSSGADLPGPTAVLEGSAGLPAGLQAMVDRHLASGLGVSVRVVLSPEDRGPLLEAEEGGILPDPRERRGALRVRATARVEGPAGLVVSRSVTFERAYKVVSRRPPLLGRFVLYVHARDGVEPNRVAAEMVTDAQDPAVGEVRLRGGPRPLVVDAGEDVPVVPPGGDTLDLAPLADAAGAAPDLLDRQGWVYLGASDEERWVLRPTLGRGEHGESPTYPAEPRKVLYLDSEAENLDFFVRVGTALQRTRCDPDLSGQDAGLFHLLHGWTTNYQVVGEQNVSTVQTPGGERTRLKLGVDGRSSLLRLFGTPDRFSPTLVFGPVERELVQRASVRVKLRGCERARASPGGGIFRVPVYLPGEHAPLAQRLVDRMFRRGTGDDLATEGTTTVREPAAAALNALADLSRSGVYGPRGTLLRDRNRPPRAERLSSARVPGVGTLDPEAPLDEEALGPLFRGELALGDHFRGSLGGGLEAAARALARKQVYRVREGARARVRERRLLVDEGGERVLRVPGILYLPGEEPLVLDGVDRIAEGGVLLVEGPVEITGDLRRGGGETLTVVSLTGDVRIGAASEVEAYLVAVGGRVRFPSGDVTIRGGVATRALDLDALAGQRVRLEYDPDLDPMTAGDDAYRVYFGDSPEQGVRLAVGGGG